MPDNKRKRGKADRRKAALGQDYEIAYVAKKYRVKMGLVRYGVALVGNDREELCKFVETVVFWMRER